MTKYETLDGRPLGIGHNGRIEGTDLYADELAEAGLIRLVVVTENDLLNKPGNTMRLLVKFIIDRGMGEDFVEWMDDVEWMEE